MPAALLLTHIFGVALKCSVGSLFCYVVPRVLASFTNILL